jgi:hypothetical protein
MKYEVRGPFWEVWRDERVVVAGLFSKRNANQVQGLLNGDEILAAPSKAATGSAKAKPETVGKGRH